MVEAGAAWLACDALRTSTGSKGYTKIEIVIVGRTPKQSVKVVHLRRSRALAVYLTRAGL